MLEIKLDIPTLQGFLVTSGGIALGWGMERWRQKAKRNRLAGKTLFRRPYTSNVSQCPDAEDSEWTVRRIDPSIGPSEPRLNKIPQAPSEPIEPLIEAPAEVGPVADPHFLTVFVMAPADAPFMGYELLQAILSTRMTLGASGYFHRHRDEDPNGPVLFSLSSMEGKGTFDMDRMGVTQCSGLCLFMQLNPVKGNQARLNAMLELAHQLSEDLCGRLLDERKKPLNRESFIQYVRRIREFEQSLARCEA